MTTLRMAWCSTKAARYAVEHWHYSKRMPAGKNVCVGVHEGLRFVGAVIFSRGANRNMAKSVGLQATECCELVRVALREHEHPVTEIVAKALALLKTQSPGLRLVVSFADPNFGHHGGIYQAGNWLYLGRTSPKKAHVDSHGRLLHTRVTSSSGDVVQYGKRTIVPYRQHLRERLLVGKHRYVYPLDKQTRRRFAKLAQPYPPAVEVSEGHAPRSRGESRVRPPETAPSS